MIGPLELAILLVIILLIVGYRYSSKLPSLGRKAGEQTRELRQKAGELSEKATPKAKELKGSIQDKVGDRADPQALGRQAGKGLREVREFRDALTGKTPAQPAQTTTQPKSEPAPETEAESAPTAKEEQRDA